MMMVMKNIIKTFTQFLLGVAVLASCEVDPLNKLPQSSLSPEEFFSTESGQFPPHMGLYTTTDRKVSNHEKEFPV
jgi:hypothetical protein